MEIPGVLLKFTLGDDEHFVGTKAVEHLRGNLSVTQLRRSPKSSWLIKITIRHLKLQTLK